MSDYLVVWKINISADTPEEAARIAQRYQRDPRGLATLYHVTPFCPECRDHHVAEEQIIDLQEGTAREH